MFSPGFHAAIFFKGASVVAGAAAAATVLPSRPAMAMPGFSKVVDLTHTFDDKFPTFGGTPGIKLNKVFDFEKNGYNLYQWVIEEHSGTIWTLRSISRRMARALPKSRLSKLVVPSA